MTNPLFSKVKIDNKTELPQFDAIKDVHVVPGITKLLEESKSRLLTLESNAHTFTLPELLLELEKMDDELGIQWGAIEHLKAVADYPELRAAVDEIKPKVVDLGLEVAQSKALYAALKKHEGADMKENESRVLKSAIKDRELSGISLSGEEAEKFNEYTKELSALSTKFSSNVLDATKAYEKIVTDVKDLEGVPQDFLELFAAAAKEKGHDGATKESGPFLLTLDIPSYLPIAQYCKNRALREELYRARIRIAGEGEFDNSEIIQSILTLKHKKSKLLGYSNYAETSCETKMATTETATELLENLLSKSMVKAKEEHVELEAYAKKHGAPTPLELWDVTYWSETMQKDLYSFNDEDLRPYFPLDNILDGLFGLIRKLFNVNVKERSDLSFPKWDDSVRFFEVSNPETGDTIAYFFLDVFVRPKNKRQGAWMNEVVRSSKTGIVVGDHRIPVAHIVCNQNPPVGDTPSLLTWRDVETLFHESGHALQHMLTNETMGLCSGINNVEWDAVELPSQFMENWVYNYDTIKTFAKHWKTGEPMPKTLFDNVYRARNYRAASFLIRQLHFGITDFTLHHKYDPTSDQLTAFQIEDEISKRTKVIPALPEDRFLCSFSHIFAGGYAAGYFSYLWAEVLSADAFEAFVEVGLENDQKIRELGAKFRNTVLGMGGGKAPAEVFKLFRGREASIDALLKHKGLSQ